MKPATMYLGGHVAAADKVEHDTQFAPAGGRRAASLLGGSVSPNEPIFAHCPEETCDNMLAFSVA
jgi:hypothetical protein